jgi:hypothetical protein
MTGCIGQCAAEPEDLVGCLTRIEHNRFLLVVILSNLILSNLVPSNLVLWTSEEVVCLLKPPVFVRHPYLNISGDLSK